MISLDSVADILAHVGSGRLSPKEALVLLTWEDIARFVQPSFADPANLKPIGVGRGVLVGDATGVLVLSREVAQALIDYGRSVGSCCPYIYSVPDGDIDDFPYIKQCSGFLTNNPGRTTWAVVQAGSENVPAVMDVPCEYIEDPARRRQVRFVFQNGSSLVLDLPVRFLRLTTPTGHTCEVHEGDAVAISGLTGEIYLGVAEVIPSIPGTIYELLLKAYMEAAESVGFHYAWDHLTETKVFRQHRIQLAELINHCAFSGFQAVKRYALENTDLKVFATAHNPLGMAKARLLASDIFLAGNELVINTSPEHYGLGLLRDERMWTQTEHIDLLRLIFLGREVLRGCFDGLQQTYLRIHTEALYRTLSVGTGAMAVVRTLCMPYNKLFPDDFDSKAFAQKYGLAHAGVVRAIRNVSGEQETYHGCRGMRVFCQRPDIAELWLTAVLSAVRRLHSEGIPIKLRLLLATVTLPAEVQWFVKLYDALAPQILGSAISEIDVSIFCMLETAAAYITLEELFSIQGRYVAIKGGLIGSNDFTAACLNFNRADSVRTIIPGYIKQGLMCESPFQRLYEPVVGKAILSALRRSRTLSRTLSLPLCWGLGGELAGDWKTVQWLVQHAAPLGLHHVSTPPDNIVTSLFAAAQASVQE